MLSYYHTLEISIMNPLAFIAPEKWLMYMLYTSTLIIVHKN